MPAVFYVNAASTNPQPPYASWSTAATGIAVAVDAAVGGDTILVTNGVYAVTNQITMSRDVILESVNGLSNTVLDGSFTTRCLFVEATNAVITGFTVRNGRTPGEGGGVYLVDGSLLEKSFVVSNAAGSAGGGVYIRNSGGVRDSTIAYNAAAVFGGGGIYAIFDCIISNCTVNGNVAMGTADGGGIYLLIGGTARDCDVAGNSARTGGGITARGNSAIINCVVSSNTAGQGGGVSCMDRARIQNCTIADNTAQVGGGLDAFYGGAVHNSIIYFNTAGTGSNYYFQGSISMPSVAFSCLSPVASGTGNIDANPAFLNRPLGDYHIPLASPCVDAGESAGAPAEDRDSKPRPVDGDASSTAEFDIGAYEAQLP